MLRIRLEPEDLGRTRFCPGPLPLVETMASVLTSQLGTDGPTGGWRRHALQRLRHTARPLLEAIPPTGYVPAFFASLETDITAALQAVEHAPDEWVRSELASAFGDRRRSPFVEALAAGDRAARAMLTRALRAYFESCLQPHWRSVNHCFEFERNRFGRFVLQDGMRSAISGLHPAMRWHHHVLEVAGGADVEIVSAGRGLVLVPSTAWSGWPLAGRLRDGTVIVVYGTRWSLPAVPEAESATADPLGNLLGQTRARILRALADPCGTVTLARRVALSPASVSAHTGVLRQADLIVTVRSGRNVRHALTPLGQLLLARHRTPACESPPRAGFG
jgi:DNA-binding transcriptional ArsR family regulator